MTSITFSALDDRKECNKEILCSHSRCQMYSVYRVGIARVDIAMYIGMKIREVKM